MSEPYYFVLLAHVWRDIYCQVVSFDVYYRRDGYEVEIYLICKSRKVIKVYR